MTTNNPRWWNRVTFAFDPNIAQANAGEILVGLGRSQDAEQQGVILNSKYPDSPFRSVSHYVLAADAATLARWQARLPNGLADVHRVVLEDLSLDTCFSLLVFMELLARVARIALRSRGTMVPLRHAKIFKPLALAWHWALWARKWSRPSSTPGSTILTSGSSNCFAGGAGRASWTS